MSLAPFVERRNAARLRETPLRRRSHVRHSAARDRRGRRQGFDVAELLETNLDRYPTKAGLCAFLRSLLYSAELAGDDAWRTNYVAALRRALHIVQSAEGPREAIATLQGYQAYSGSSAWSSAGDEPDEA